MFFPWWWLVISSAVKSLQFLFQQDTWTGHSLFLCGFWKNTLGPSRCNKSYLLSMCGSMELCVEWRIVTVTRAMLEAVLLLRFFQLWSHSVKVCVALLSLHIFLHLMHDCVHLQPTSLRLSSLLCFICLYSRQLEGYSTFHLMRFESGAFVRPTRKVYSVCQLLLWPPYINPQRSLGECIICHDWAKMNGKAQLQNICYKYDVFLHFEN